VIDLQWLIAPAIGWGAWLLLHSVAIPWVYARGKKDCSVEKQQQSSYEQE